MTATASTVPFAGWYRPDKRHRWTKLAQAEDYGGCLNLLLDRVKAVPGNHELLVSQIDPNGKGRQTQRELLFR